MMYENIPFSESQYWSKMILLIPWTTSPWYKQNLLGRWLRSGWCCKIDGFIPSSEPFLYYLWALFCFANGRQLGWSETDHFPVPTAWKMNCLGSERVGSLRFPSAIILHPSQSIYGGVLLPHSPFQFWRNRGGSDCCPDCLQRQESQSFQCSW